MCVAAVTHSGIAHPHCKLFSHTYYPMHTNHHHHHTYESPKQYHSTQLSHTFNNDNIVIRFTTIVRESTLKESHVPRM